MLSRHLIKPSRSPFTNGMRIQTRTLTSSPALRKWEGRQPDEHTTREKDSHNVQHDADREGKKERAEGEGNRGATEKSGGSNEKAKKEFPEAPDTIGMQDERGGKA